MLSFRLIWKVLKKVKMSVYHSIRSEVSCVVYCLSSDFPAGSNRRSFNVQLSMVRKQLCSSCCVRAISCGSIVTFCCGGLSSLKTAEKAHRLAAVDDRPPIRRPLTTEQASVFQRWQSIRSLSLLPSRRRRDFAGNQARIVWETTLWQDFWGGGWRGVLHSTRRRRSRPWQHLHCRSDAKLHR